MKSLTRTHTQLRALLAVLSICLIPLSWASDNSSRTLYILSDTPVSHLDLGLYRLDLALESELRPELARFLNILPDRIHTRTYVTVGQDTSMVLVLETTVDAAPDRERSKLQAENICELVQGAQVRFMRTNRLITFFNSKDPFTDKRPMDFAANLESVLRLKGRVPSGGALPTTECMRPLRQTSNE